MTYLRSLAATSSSVSLLENTPVRQKHTKLENTPVRQKHMKLENTPVRQKHTKLENTAVRAGSHVPPAATSHQHAPPAAPCARSFPMRTFLRLRRNLRRNVRGYPGERGGGRLSETAKKRHFKNTVKTL